MRNFFKSFTSNMVNKYRKMSIRAVIARSFTTVSIIGMFFISFSLVLHFSNASSELIIENTERVIKQANINLDSYLKKMMRISDTIYYTIIKNSDLDKDNISQSINLLYEENKDFVVSISLFTGTGDLIHTSPLSILKQSAKPHKSVWFLSALDKIENMHFSSPHIQNIFDKSNNQYNWVISLSRYVQLTYSGITKSGVLLVDMSFSGIEQVCKNIELANNGYVYLIDRNGEIIYHPKQQLIYAGIEKENNIKAATYQDGTTHENFLSQKRLVTIKTVGYTGWKLVGIVPNSISSTLSPKIWIFGLSILLFAAFLLTFINFRISSYISEPIKRLEHSINNLKIGQSELEIEEGNCYEVERLNHTIRTMVSTMNHLTEDIIEQERQKRRSELEILQSQINPHFLYNTLDSVIWMVEAGRYQESIQMVTSLARFFRISLSKGKRIIPLESELEHAKHYMNIQQMRFKNRFTTQITYNTEIKNIYTLKLVLQPILENAIYHGMSSYDDDDGIINVNTWCDNNDLIIDITDNGLGIRPEVLNSLLDENKPQIKTSGSGMGVRNVHRRIQLNFGEQYGLTILSEPDEGTCVRIRLPILTEKQANNLEENI